MNRATPTVPPDRAPLPGRGFDLLAVLAALLVTAVGLANLWAVDGPGLAVRQGMYALVGLALGWALGHWRVRRLGALSWGCYGLSVVLLLAVMIAGSSANGATRWLDIGPVTFQPSELAKLGLLLALAAVLGSPGPAWRRFGLAAVIAVVPIGLTVAQPDLSTCALLTALTGCMLLLARVPARLLLPLFAAGALAAPLVVGMLQPYQVQRLGSFLVGSHEAAAGAGWAVTQARIAVGSSALVGPGHPLTGLLAQYLPERHTDLAVASVVEQFGILVGVAVVLAALVLVWRLALAAAAPRSPPGALLASGLAVLFGVETVVSLGGNLGLLPLAGVPFPLLSYGGSALVVHLATLGAALGVRRDGERRRLWRAPWWRARRPRWVRVAAVGITALLVLFAGYGGRLRAVDGPELAAQGIDQMTRCMRIPAPRGEITDRHGAPLATTGAAAQSEIHAVPALLKADPAALNRLATLVGQPAEAIRTTLSAATATTLAVRVAKVDAPVAAGVAKAGIPGVVVVPGQRRSYPTGAVLGSLLGYTGIATPSEHRRWPDLPLGVVVGRTGLEQQYDAVLRGVDGRQCVYVNPLGEPVAMGERTDPVPGANLRLSLDLGLQRVLTDGLARAMAGQPDRVGAAVAMDPKTGQLLALASVPSYDNNVYGPPADPAGLEALAKVKGSPMREHAAQSAVPPGSTFKLVVATANQLTPRIPPEKVIPTGGSYTLGDHTFGNWKPMGPMNLTQALAWSNDVYFYKLAVALGPQPMIDAARALGVGQATGIDLPAESPGYLGTPESVREDNGTWYPGSTVIMGIGQGYLSVTPLQNARWTAAVATGRMVTPRLGLATGGGNTWAALPAPAPVALPFAGSLRPVQDGMRAVVTGGTASSLASLPAPVGAKTGTAEDGSMPNGTYDNWLTAVAPAHDPGIVVTTLTQGSGQGANSASTVGRDALAHYLGHQVEIEQTAPIQRP
ncbi:FtsW/RodA/SpoVE family cell cycle protein [Pseudonocardia acaciae]|uniref:FtsW/RodA/SpoVE family cell cycle protein n=1 Tax=Pseudonocardia acaciae TaxID=551276 RepID=UPI0006869842|nr:FtsW/RodA/SpoVE family cell cycle protein [Pseudonocardia acaciae]